MTPIILLIDDDADDREIFCEVVKEIPCEAVCYAIPNGHEALRQMEENKIETPSLIFLDINMPIMNGWQCLEALKKHEKYNHIPVVMYSTSSMPRDVEKAKELGAICLYCKPSSITDLRSALEAFITHLANGFLINTSLKHIQGLQFY